jgi:hypothetical protein
VSLPECYSARGPMSPGVTSRTDDDGDITPEHTNICVEAENDPDSKETVWIQYIVPFDCVPKFVVTNAARPRW